MRSGSIRWGCITHPQVGTCLWHVSNENIPPMNKLGFNIHCTYRKAVSLLNKIQKRKKFGVNPSIQTSFR